MMQTTAFATSGEIRVATTGALPAATGQTLEPVALAGCQGAPALAGTLSPLMNLFEQRATATKDAGPPAVKADAPQRLRAFNSS